MSTQQHPTQQQPPAPPSPKHGAADPSPAQITLPPDQLVKCPVCQSLLHAAELVAYEPQEFPRILWKQLDSKPPQDPPQFESRVVKDEDEEKKAEGEGWVKERSKPDDQKKDAPRTSPEAHQTKR